MVPAPRSADCCGITSDDATLFLIEWRGGTAGHLITIGRADIRRFVLARAVIHLSGGRGRHALRRA
ncbi:hypothetical protein OHA79_40775 [Streptomyces sp. NBC_00841]|uniref:hypothetical protein n=1 Tax=unclassified Streptomyces TaxID=2593676 RepID=UPI002253BCB2|nr:MULTISPECIES: hypothetical protein [unclassified Streptomyces]MCX4530653.1 hypothetical protein [Streptomyces sp. NBC_01669]WSA03596.1 hypothetical protein OHA79_40775 [Streptomyces sp. NBC_00841]